MRAIVLTYDRNASITEHMIKCYEDLWPNNPFTFRISFQNENRCIIRSNREYIKTSPGIKETVLELLSDLDDETWIYWCIDDKYPIKLHLPYIEFLHRSLNLNDISDMSGIIFCRARNMLNPDCLLDQHLYLSTEILIERKAYHQIWIHQFLKVKVIRYLFLNFPYIHRARTMDPLKDMINKPHDHRIFVTELNHAVFGESTSDRVLTANCQQSMLNKGLVIPPFFEVNINQSTIIGSL